MLYEFLDYSSHTFSLIPFGLKFVLIKIIGSIRSLFGFEDVLVIGGGYAMGKMQGIRDSEYERLVCATGSRYYANIGRQNRAYRDKRGAFVQLWKNASVLTKDWRSDGFFNNIGEYFGNKKFKNIIVDYGVLHLMSSTYKEWIEFIKTHLTETGVVTLPKPASSEEERDRYRREQAIRGMRFGKDVFDFTRDLAKCGINCKYTTKHRPC